MNTLGWNWKKKIVVMLLVVPIFAHAANREEPALSAAEQASVTKRIRTLKSPTDRKVAEGWSNAKKVAELICRPAALPVLKKHAEGVDRVFLGTDKPESLTLESDRRLTGRGQFRATAGWQDFSFTCDLNPETGKVVSFVPVLSKAAQ